MLRVEVPGVLTKVLLACMQLGVFDVLKGKDIQLSLRFTSDFCI